MKDKLINFCLVIGIISLINHLILIIDGFLSDIINLFSIFILFPFLLILNMFSKIAHKINKFRNKYSKISLILSVWGAYILASLLVNITCLGIAASDEEFKVYYDIANLLLFCIFTIIFLITLIKVLFIKQKENNNIS